MKILLDALQAGNQSGTGTYAGALIEYLPGTIPNLQVNAAVPADMMEDLRCSALREIVPCSTARPPRGTILRSRQMRAAIRQIHPDIIHYPATFARVAGRGGSDARVVVTVHDLSFLRNPAWFTARRSAYYRLAIRPTVRSADLILADSEVTALDLRSMLHVPEAKVVVTPLGVNEQYTPASEERIRDVRARYALPPRFFLYLGTIEPRKNLARVIDAFDSIAPACELDLVIAGRVGWAAESTREAHARAKHSSRIHFTGFIAGEDAPAILSAADVFVWPSLWEGFGLPPLEAMACGTPVITSSTSSLPEVVGDAAIQVNPEETGAIAEAMRALADNDTERERLRTAGRERARQFTWRRTAELTAQAYQRVLGG